MKYTRIITYLIVFLLLIGSCLFAHSVYPEYEFYISIVASSSSIISVLVSIIEIIHVRNTTEAVSQSLDETKREINEFLSFSEINEMTRLIDEIEAYINDNHYESAWLKLKDFKGQLDKQSAYIEKTHQSSDFPKKLKMQKVHLSMDIRNLFKKINDTSTPLEKNVIIDHLDSTKECLNELSGRLKVERI